MSLVADYRLQQKMNNPPLLSKPTRSLGWLALLVAVALNGVLAAISVQFFRVPAGSFIRPMGWGLLSMVIWASGVLGVATLSAVAAAVQRTFVLSFLAVALGVVAFFVPGWLLHWAAHVNGFVVAE